MMMNLFSVFDPSSSIFSISWIIIFSVILLVPNKMLTLTNPFMKLFSSFLIIFNSEVKFNLKKSEKGSEILIMMAFLLIIILNFIALYPQTFSVTSHLTITLPISLLFWMTVVMFGWFKNTNHMLSHLLPQGTPVALMSFMVLIELVSMVIRPLTLCVRLTANLIAGHLLMSLLGNSMMAIPSYWGMAMMVAPLILTILESAVACIQAYVFMTLITLYTMEVK